MTMAACTRMSCRGCRALRASRRALHCVTCWLAPDRRPQARNFATDSALSQAIHKGMRRTFRNSVRNRTLQCNTIALPLETRKTVHAGAPSSGVRVAIRPLPSRSDFSAALGDPMPSFKLSLRFRLVCVAVCSLAFVPSSSRAEVPTPISVLGHNPGDDFYLADYEDTVRYFHALAAASDRIKLFTVGKTTRGKDIELAVISSPQNLVKLDDYKQIAGRLAHATDLNDDQAKELARTSKVIVHIDGGLHADEVAGPQHTMVLAYKLLSAQNDPQVDAILDQVILVLWPTLNPDGQDMVVHWYRQNLGTKYEVSPMPWLYQDYVGHDNNRDGYMMNMKEEQVVVKTQLEYS